ncbi:phage head closure protein [Novosphingobium sp. KN65.2]|uniref:phage head closure protein n=1 Tax=Novosphingobium sp. KN65.2 TaxID=1478134 RepID=UPI0005E35555|nr:phage head closure protein [Novosphingobium sp. KN65.2]CDO35001.1 putative Phage head-tail adaptor [Novosphingobium sp. KN65.2]
MRLSAGDLDRRITFQSRSETQGGAHNRKTVNWVNFATMWAQVQDTLPSRAESIDDNMAIQRRPCRIRCRFREDITSDMRIIYGSRTLRIISGPVEIGRREGLELMAEEYSTEGTAP